jgi:hypothetical protein
VEARRGRGPRAVWHGGQRRRCCAAEGEAEEEERGGQGLMCNLKNSRVLDVKQDFLTGLYLK